MFLLWGISSVFMQIVLFVFCLKHGRHENHLSTRTSIKRLTTQQTSFSFLNADHVPDYLIKGGEETSHDKHFN